MQVILKLDNEEVHIEVTPIGHSKLPVLNNFQVTMIGKKIPSNKVFVKNFDTKNDLLLLAAKSLEALRNEIKRELKAIKK